jgi:hypothetical protein
MGQTLKVLNAVRSHEIGIPLTLSQFVFPRFRRMFQVDGYVRYMYASPAHLVHRLTARNLHLLALRISEYLSPKPDVVLKHWACAKIVRSKPTTTGTGKEAELSDDDAVCNVIVEKSQKLGGGSVSYADIAKRAWEVGRPGLAIKVSAPFVFHVPTSRLKLFLSCWTSRRMPLTRCHFFLA